MQASLCPEDGSVTPDYWEYSRRDSRPLSELRNSLPQTVFVAPSHLNPLQRRVAPDATPASACGGVFAASLWPGARL